MFIVPISTFLIEMLDILSGKELANTFPEKIVNINVLDLSQATADLRYYESQQTIYFWAVLIGVAFMLQQKLLFILMLKDGWM